MFTEEVKYLLALSDHEVKETESDDLGRETEDLGRETEAMRKKRCWPTFAC